MTEETITVLEFLNRQEKLESDALEALPFDPKECSYSLGPLCQQLYACLTCFDSKNPEIINSSRTLNPNYVKIYNAVCYTCSIKCHTSHHLIPLYTKRDFQCDCGTSRLPSSSPCQVRSTSNDIANNTNRYNHNFEGKYCSCGRMYDEEGGDNEELADQGTMIQCMLGDVCGEDWFHEGCILGLNKPIPDRSKDQQSVIPEADDFGAFICWKCVGKWTKELDELINIDGVLLKTIDKPSISSLNRVSFMDKGLDDEHQSKRQKIETSPVANKEFSIFLQKDYKAKLNTTVKSQSLESFLNKFSHIHNKDSVYEPPIDKPTTEQDSIVAMNDIPRDKAIEGIIAYNDIKDKLKGFLKDFAESGKVVEKGDISTFFDCLNKKKK